MIGEKNENIGEKKLQSNWQRKNVVRFQYHKKILWKSFFLKLFYILNKWMEQDWLEKKTNGIIICTYVVYKIIFYTKTKAIWLF